MFTCLTMLIIQVQPVYGSEDSQEINKENTEFEQKIVSGFTAEGIYYEVFSDYTSDVCQIETVCKYVKRTVKYLSATITVPQSLYWEENIDGLLYSGNLVLSKYTRDYDNGITIAYFEGYLYAE